MTTEARPITNCLRLVSEGKREGLDQLIEILYTTLWRMCRRHLGWAPVGSLTPTALLHELYLDLHKRSPDLENREEFFGYAHVAVKHLAIGLARKMRARKRGGEFQQVDLDEIDLPDDREGPEIVEVFEVLARVAKQDPKIAQIIRLRVFDGHSERETAKLLGISRGSLQKQWEIGRRLLGHLLAPERKETDVQV